MNIFEEDLDNISATLIKDFFELKDKNIFLTGGTGFVGTWLVYSFLKFAPKLNAKMFLISRNPELFLAKNPSLRSNPHLHFTKGDVRDFEFPKESFDYVIHGATDVVRVGENVGEVMEVNYLGTKRVIEFCRQKKIKKYLHISSGAVYGPQPADIVRMKETHLGAPDIGLSSSAYGESKRIAEWLSCQGGREYDFEVKRARCFAMIGPHLTLNARFAIGNFINDILNDRDILIREDGTAFRSYMYASDMMIWLWKILFYGLKGEVYNVGSDQEINLIDLAYKCIEVSKSSVKVNKLKLPEPAFSISRYVPCIEKFYSINSGLAPFALDKAIKRTLDYYKGEAAARNSTS